MNNLVTGLLVLIPILILALTLIYLPGPLLAVFSVFLCAYVIGKAINEPYGL